jgi:hypothetical protein
VTIMERLGLPADGVAGRPLTITARVRQAVMAAWHHKCAYCLEREAEHLDHIIPQAKGGPDCLGNFTAACAPCNLMKTDTMLPDGILAILIQKAIAKAPKIHEALNPVTGLDRHDRRAQLRQELADWHVRDECLLQGRELDPAYEAQIRAEVDNDFLEAGVMTLRDEIRRLKAQVKDAEARQDL